MLLRLLGRRARRRELGPLQGALRLLAEACGAWLAADSGPTSGEGSIRPFIAIPLLAIGFHST